MYLVRTVTERTRGRTLLARLRGGADAVTGPALVADALPPGLAAVAGAGELEALRRSLVEHPSPPVRPRLGRDDFKGALGVFLLVVAATFPVVVPFILFDQAALAVRVSNLVALVMLFIAGWILAVHAGGSRWQGGTAMAATGAVLVAAIMALGG
jgi:VIT1/CCC1 family predicted Fe2+/Mn2+ transporter